MKTGISIWSMPANRTLAENFDLAARSGFDCLEPALNETGEMSLESKPAELRKLRKAAADAGIEIRSVATGLYWKWSLTDDDAAVRKQAAGVTRKMIDAAAVLGAEVVLVVPGVVGVDFIPGCPVVDYEAAWTRALDALRRLAPYAADKGVDIGVENVWNKFLISPLEMRNFIDAIDSPAVGAYFDAGNVLAFGYPDQWARILGQRIRRVHVKDFRRSVGTIDGFVDLLEGDVDFAATMKELRKIGYDGPVTAEIAPPRVGFEAEITAARAAVLRRIISQ